jgi:hypothetical protein
MNQFPILPIQRTGEGDALQYAIYPVYSDVNLKNVLDYTLDLISTWTDDYIWNSDPFTLSLDPSVPKLQGSMDLGEDSGASPDEWVVVGALWQVSKRFHDVIIRHSRFHVMLTQHSRRRRGISADRISNAHSRLAETRDSR